MSYDYSGGGLGGPNRHMAQAIAALRAGQTKPQRERAFLDKVLLTGAGTAIGTVGHLIDAKESTDLQANQKKAGIMRDAIRDQSKLSGEQDAIRKNSQQYASPDYAGPSAMDERYGQPPAWLTQHIQSEANGALDNQSTNAGAAGVAVGGYDTPDGIANTANTAGQQAHDYAEFKNIAATGGMMNSLPRVQR